MSFRLFTKTQLKTIAFFWFIYFSYYLCRYDMSVAKVGLGSELHINKAAIGLILSLFTFAYAIGQIFSGYFADRIFYKKILIIGLSGTALANIFLGFSSLYWLIAGLWLLNGLFQSTGWSTSSKAVAKVLDKQSRGMGVGLWGTGNQLGGAVAIILAGFLLEKYNWRVSFYVPALLMFLPLLLVAFSKPEEPKEQKMEALARPKLLESFRLVFKNRNILLIMLVYMLLGYIRYSFINWGLEYQKEALHLSLSSSFLNLSLLPLGGVAGVLLAGFVSDKLLKSKRVIVSFLVMGALTLFVFWFMLLKAGNAGFAVPLLAVIGILIAAGDNFIGATTTFEFSKQGQEGSAIGLVDAFMYIGAIGSGYLNGYLVDHYGWGPAKYLWVLSGLLATVILVPLIKTEKSYEAVTLPALAAEVVKGS